MERGLRVLIDPVDDAIENKNIIEEVLKPYEYVKKRISSKPRIICKFCTCLWSRNQKW